MKKIILIFLFLTSSISSVLACDVKIIPFGSGKEKININPLPLSFPNQFDSETVIVPISDICKNDKDLFGTNVNFLFIKNKLTQISLFRPSFKDAKLMDYAMKRYGEFSIPAGIKKENFKGNYTWKKVNENIHYINTDIEGTNAEILEINNDLYLTELQNYNEKIGQWLDSQK